MSSSDSGEFVDQINLSASSVSNIDSGHSEDARPNDISGGQSHNVSSTKRQRSGSDVFEMIRPKLKTMRKHSGVNNTDK